MSNFFLAKPFAFFERHKRGQRMIKPCSIFLLAAMLGSGPALAQNQPAQRGPNNNAINSSDQNNSNAPIAGRNSFTEGQAKSKIEAAGYSNASELAKDKDGVWRGKANKGGTQTEVSLDFQGNVNVVK